MITFTILRQKKPTAFRGGSMSVQIEFGGFKLNKKKLNNKKRRLNGN